LTNYEKIFLDMDGVLVDFVGAAGELMRDNLGISSSDWIKAGKSGEYNITKRLARLKGCTEFSSKKLFWKIIDDAGEKFWGDMPTLPLARELFMLCNEHVNDYRDIIILTSPPLSPSALPGKVMMIKHLFHNVLFPEGRLFSKSIRRYMSRNFIITTLSPKDDVNSHRGKHLLARPGRVLIDDSQANVEKFTQAGGHGIIYPQQWNTLHATAAQGDEISYVAGRLEDGKSEKGGLL